MVNAALTKRASELRLWKCSHFLNVQVHSEPLVLGGWYRYRSESATKPPA
jgi:hypothetical protein